MLVETTAVLATANGTAGVSTATTTLDNATYVNFGSYLTIKSNVFEVS